MRNPLSLIAAGFAGLLAATSVSALTFTATGTGPVTAYFYGQSAGYGSDIGMWVNGVAVGTYGLQNHLTAPGTSFVLGNASAGDTIMFELRVSTGNSSGPPPLSYSLFSDPAYNSVDGFLEHAVTSSFAGGPFGIPAGTFVGFEDIIPLASSDLDFNDHQFVFVGVQGVSAPDSGATLTLLGMALAGLKLLRRKA